MGRMQDWWLAEWEESEHHATAYEIWTYDEEKLLSVRTELLTVWD
jgi:hypothetical protein